jgi:hypothetical protein
MHMKCKSCKEIIEAREVKTNQGKCPRCKQPAGKKYRYPARPRQKGKSKRTQQERLELSSRNCGFSSGKFNQEGRCSKAGLNVDNTLCHRCLK